MLPDDFHAISLITPAASFHYYYDSQDAATLNEHVTSASLPLYTPLKPCCAIADVLRVTMQLFRHTPAPCCHA